MGERQRIFFLRHLMADAGKFLFVLLFVLLHCAPALSQKWPSELWHDGRILLVEGDTVKGFVKYDLNQNIVQFSPDDRNVTVFSPRKVLFFEIFDNTVHQYRQFYALPYASGGSYHSPVFFELLAEGKITLLCRESVEFRSVPIGYGGTYSREVLVYNYFLLDDKGDISPFNGKKHDLLDMMGKNADAVEKFIRANHLKIEEKYDFSRIVAYYNSLQRT
jgi:hypothetical protein